MFGQRVLDERSEAQLVHSNHSTQVLEFALDDGQTELLGFGLSEFRGLTRRLLDLGLSRVDRDSYLYSSFLRWAYPCDVVDDRFGRDFVKVLN
jgi:hypothetical protein